MITIPVSTHIKADGAIDLHLATGLPESEAEVVVVVQPMRRGASAGNGESWDSFIERFSGIFADDPIQRGDQGWYEERETIR